MSSQSRATIPKFLRLKCVRLRKDGLTYPQIQQRIQLEDERTVSIPSMSRIYKKFTETGSVDDRRRCGPPRCLGPAEREKLDARMEEDDETSARDLQTHLNTPNTSTSTICRERRRLGWIRGSTRYCQTVRKVNQEKRFVHCARVLAKEDTFDDVIFTDECTVQLESHVSLCYRRKGSAPKLKPKPKHPYKVHVWAGVSRRGTTELCIFTGKLNSIGYQGILEECLLPFIQKKYPEGHRFMQDNDPKHTSRSTQDWCTANDVVHWVTPLNPPTSTQLRKCGLK